MDISGFSGNSVILWCFSASCLVRSCFLEADTWECTWCFTESRHLRGCTVFGKSVTSITQTARGRSCIAMLCSTLLVSKSYSMLRWSLLVFTGEKWEKTEAPPMVFWLILAASPDSCWFASTVQLLLEQATATDSCLAGLDCWYPDSKKWICPQGTTSKQVHSIPINLLFLCLWSVG